MKREMKFIRVSKNVVVALGNFEGFGCATMFLDCAQMSARNIEDETKRRFFTQVNRQKKDMGVVVSAPGTRYEYDIQWYDYCEVNRTKKNIMEQVCDAKPGQPMYVVDIDANGTPCVKKAEHLFTEDEVKTELLRIALGGRNG